ncbi:MAG: hypothetical protein JSR17_02150 [Proteobacteria bacterium]|nr:hypothetical protein [Pseudomonadota bacterium]
MKPLEHDPNRNETQVVQQLLKQIGIEAKALENIQLTKNKSTNDTLLSIKIRNEQEAKKLFEALKALGLNPTMKNGTISLEGAQAFKFLMEFGGMEFKKVMNLYQEFYKQNSMPQPQFSGKSFTLTQEQADSLNAGKTFQGGSAQPTLLEYFVKLQKEDNTGVLKSLEEHWKKTANDPEWKEVNMIQQVTLEQAKKIVAAENTNPKTYTPGAERKAEKQTEVGEQPQPKLSEHAKPK